MADTRREFLTKLAVGAGGIGLGLSAQGGIWSQLAGDDGIAHAAPPKGESVWAEGKDPYKTTVAAIKKLGGMDRFVKQGQRVALLPNVGWNRTPEQAACTHPEVLRAVIDLVAAEDAKSITVFCNPCNPIRACLENSGIGAMVDKSPARFEVINSQGWRLRKAVKGCTFMKEAQVYRLVDDCDVLINVPVAKHHGGAQLTMCCKNRMGLVKDRGVMHQKLHAAIADLTMMVPHALCVLDASRILTAHGPSGGNLKDVKKTDTVVAGTHPAEVDVLGCGLFGNKPGDIGYLRMLGERNFVNLDPAKLDVDYIKA